MKKNILYFTSILVLAMGCNRIDVIDDSSSSMPIVCRVDGVFETGSSSKASLVTTDNISEMYAEMTVHGVKRNTSATSDDVLFTDTFVPSSTEPTSLTQMWKEDSYVFYSYPSNVGITPSFKDNGIVFNQTIVKDSKSTPDIILARTVQTKGNDVSFTYKHIFTAVNVIYKTAKMGHKISKIAITDTPTTGICKMADDGYIYWESQGTNGNLVDEDIRYATYNGQEVTEDGCKFMTIPGKPINLEVVIDGITVKKTCEAKKAGDIVNFYIEDDFEIKKEDGSAAEGKIEENPDGTYKMTLETYVTGEYKTTIVHKPVDFLLVLDYSSSMTNSYTDKSATNYQKATVTQYSYNDWKANKTGYKATLNGKSYTITCLDLKNSSSTLDNIHWAYIEADGSRYYISLDGSLFKSTNKSPSVNNYPVSTDGITIYPSVGGNPKLWGSYAYSSTKISNRLNGLQNAVSCFLDDVVADCKENGIEHRVSVVEFQNCSFPTFTGQSSGRKNYINSTSSDYLRQCYAMSTDNQNKSTTGIQYPFRSVLEANVVDGVKSAMALTGTAGHTAIDYGMYIASLQIAKCRSDVAKTVVVFTDGKPTHAGSAIGSDNVIPGYSTSGEKKSDSQVADGAVKFSKACKDAGCSVFSVGVFSGSDKPASGFMDALSSNYPHATSVSNKGEGSDQGYYLDASSGSLKDIFQAIAKTAIELSIDIHEEAYVSAVISDAFILPADYVEGSGHMKFYECAQTGYNSSTKKIIWSTTQTDITSKITCTMDATTQTVKIKGFDYGKYYCTTDSAGPFTGKKLIMVFDGLTSNPERQGTGTNQAIEYTTGLYDDKGKPVTMFDPIYIEL